MNGFGAWLTFYRKHRFWMAVGGVLAVVLNEELGLSEEQVLGIVGILVAAILGDSRRPMHDFYST